MNATDSRKDALLRLCSRCTGGTLFVFGVVGNLISSLCIFASREEHGI